jgi:thiol-disulfide isomerase/thioredoxin
VNPKAHRLSRRFAVAAVAAFALVAGMPAAQAGVPAPQVGIASFDQLPQPLPLPYDTSANADSSVAAARQRAIAGHKLLLIDLGGNWCPDCRILAGTIETPALKRFVTSHYELVTVDVGRFDKNGQIPAHYGVTGRLQGVPSLLVIEPRADRLINAGHTAALADARHMTPQALADWLASWIN